MSKSVDVMTGKNSASCADASISASRACPIGQDGEPLRTLNFSGGGFDTVMQLGVSHALLASMGKAPDVVVGVSAGGISVGVMVGVGVGGTGDGITVSVAVGVSDTNNEKGID